MPITPGAGIHPDLLEDIDEVTFAPGSGTHPDLVDEGRIAKSAASNAQSTNRPSAEAPQEQPDESSPAEGGEAEASTSPDAAAEDTTPTETATPSWLDEIRNAADPKAALAILTAALPPDELLKDRKLAGLLGDRADKRAQEVIAAREAQLRENQKAEAVTKGDLYALGELTAPEVLARLRADADARAMEPLMEGVRAFQAQLPQEVQAEVAGRTWPGTPSQGLAAYLEAVTQSAIKHGLMPEVDREIKRREPMLRKQVLTEAHGEEPSPELTNGTGAGVREVTDEQIQGMELEEFNEYFDQYGRPKENVRHIQTNGVPIRRT